MRLMVFNSGKIITLGLLAGLFLNGCVPTVEPPPTPTPAAFLPTATAVPPTQPPATQRPSPTPSPAATATLPATATPSATATLPPTATPTPEPTAAPTGLPPDVLVLPAGEIAFQGVSFQLDGRLAPEVYPTIETWGNTGMTYTIVRFAPEGICREVGCIEVYDVAAYEAANPDFPLPPVGAATILRAQEQEVAFQNGSGRRATLMHGQDGFFANNEALLYEYQGYTEDGRFYLLVTFPIDAPILLTTYDPALNENPNAIPVPEELPTDYVALTEIIFNYNQEAARQLDGLAAVDFLPDLMLLDELVMSVWVDTAVSTP